MPPRLNEQITGYVAGDSLTLPFSVPNMPAGRTLTKAWFTVKIAKTDADVAAVLQLTITTALTSQGQITDATGVAAGALTFTATAAQTAAIGADTPRYYDVQIKDDLGQIATIEGGTITFEQGVTAATS